MSSTLVTKSPICVTGASGFIASRLVKDLLERGYEVRGTVRDASALDKYEYLTSLPNATKHLTLVSANLLEPASFEGAVQGCEYVLHTASPYSLNVKDAQKELVDPAVKGTAGVLAACAKTDGIKRVVLTSSVAAITDEPNSDTTFSEVDWNEKSSLTRNPYYFSKAEAERAAWDFMKNKEPEFDLVVINPYTVYGPSLTPALNASNQVFSDILGGKFPGIINLAFGLVDVRDVSQAHILAMEKPEASGRYLCAHETLTMRDIVSMLVELGYGNHKVPKMPLDNAPGNLLVRFASLFRPAGERSFLKTNLNRVPSFDNSKIKQELGMEFHEFRPSLDETVADLIKWGHVAAVP